jgi:hypothetical protein
VQCVGNPLGNVARSDTSFQLGPLRHPPEKQAREGQLSSRAGSRGNTWHPDDPTEAATEPSKAGLASPRRSMSRHSMEASRAEPPFEPRQPKRFPASPSIRIRGKSSSAPTDTWLNGRRPFTRSASPPIDSVARIDLAEAHTLGAAVGREHARGEGRQFPPAHAHGALGHRLVAGSRKRRLGPSAGYALQQPSLVRIA